ncbi:MAG: tetratricopeptide repeat protein, partial [Thermoanaerobaculia bacterium]
MESKTAAGEVLGVREVIAEAGKAELSAETFSDVSAAIYSADSGVSELKEILEDWDGFTKSFDSATVANVLKGYLKYVLTDLAGAEEILRREKRNEWGYCYFIRATVGLGRLEEAAELVKDARSRFPSSESLLFLAIEVACRSRRTEDAAKLLEKASDRAGASAAYAHHQALCLEAAGEYREAIEWYRRAAEREPEHAEALFRLGYLLDIYGEGDATDEAIEAYERCLKITPVHANAVVNLGVLYEDRERYHDAGKCFETV